MSYSLIVFVWIAATKQLNILICTYVPLTSRTLVNQSIQVVFFWIDGAIGTPEQTVFQTKIMSAYATISYIIQAYITCQYLFDLLICKYFSQEPFNLKKKQQIGTEYKPCLFFTYKTQDQLDTKNLNQCKQVRTKPKPVNCESRQLSKKSKIRCSNDLFV